MKLSRLVALGGLVCGAVACSAAEERPGSEKFQVELDGHDLKQALTAIVEKTCEREVECGVPNVHCSTDAASADGAEDSDTGEWTCTGSIEAADYDECVRQYRDEIEGELLGCPYDDTARTLLEACTNAYLADACVTQEELNRQLADEDSEQEEETPAACVELEELWEGCWD